MLNCECFFCIRTVERHVCVRVCIFLILVNDPCYVRVMMAYFTPMRKVWSNFGDNVWWGEECYRVINLFQLERVGLELWIRSFWDQRGSKTMLGPIWVLNECFEGFKKLFGSLKSLYDFWKPSLGTLRVRPSTELEKGYEQA